MAITKDILNALKTDFLTIKTANSYNTNLTKCHNVVRFLKDLREDEFDSFYIQGLQAKIETTESCLLVTWGIAIYFYLQTNQDTGKAGLLKDKIENLKADIVTLIKTNLTVEAVEAVSNVELTMFDPYIDALDNKAVFGIGLTIQYVD